MDKILDRFLGYVQINTQSDDTTELNPSTPQQMFFAQDLVEELKNIGLQEVTLNEYGYVMATLPANNGKEKPVVGFIAHMDTSPDMSGKNVNPRIVSNYDGGNIVLNAALGINLNPEEFPELLRYKGEDIIVTDGTTLLGADDKAGIAAIVTAMEYLLANPQIKHGKIRIAFTPDEEIGQGADHFDVAAFGADFAYTIDGGELGELEYETFNAAAATVTFHGRNVHPGAAYKKMRNSMRIASTFIYMIPRHETPEHSQDYEGFYHLTDMQGEVEKTTLHYIIRDFDRSHFESRKKEMQHYVNRINAEYGEGTAEIEIRDQYYNMREKIEPVMHIVDLAKDAMHECGIGAKVQPVRGGTDGARLSFMGLPTPNIFAGGHNFHGKYEFLPVNSIVKAMDVIVKISELATKD
ncbi:MAG: peptidase T [Bacteroidales bacterium]|nr:peptidase T [Bacteroidales bacterium]